MLNEKEKTLLSKLFGQSVQKIREEQKLLRMDLANRMQVQHTRIAQLEGGKIDPRMSTVLAVAEALGVTPGVLLDGVAREWRAARRKKSAGDEAESPECASN